MTEPAARTVRLGTRGSALAITQSGLVAHMIAQRAAELGLDLAVKIVEIRTQGDVDPSALTRLGGIGAFATALREALLDGVVLALAGLRRLELGGHVSEILPAGTGRGPSVMVPAAGQGALAVETREDLEREDPELAQVLTHIDSPGTRAAVTAERAVLARLGAGCAAPVGVLAAPAVAGGDTLRLEAVVASLDGRTVVRESAMAHLDEAGALGERVAQALLAAGAASVADLRAGTPTRGDLR